MLLVPALAMAQQVLEKKEKAPEKARGKSGQARRKSRGRQADRDRQRRRGAAGARRLPDAAAGAARRPRHRTDARRGARGAHQPRGTRPGGAQGRRREGSRSADPARHGAPGDRGELLPAEFARKNPVSEAEIQKEYDRAKSQHGDKEYKARHILVETEDQAKGLIADLKKGAKFDELATKNSKDTGSAQRGGDLDWNVPGTFDKQFSDAMVKLDKGKYTDAPVKTRFGFHIIQLDDVRPAKFAAIGEVRPRIQQMLVQNKIEQLIKGLRAKAKIE